MKQKNHDTYTCVARFPALARFLEVCDSYHLPGELSTPLALPYLTEGALAQQAQATVGELP